MLKKIFYSFLFVSANLISSLCATTVERMTLVGRVPGFFTDNIRTAHNTQTRNTLVVWQRHRGNQEKHAIWGRLLSGDGIPAGPAFQIVSGPNAQFPEVVYNPDANQFLLLYSNEIAGPNRFEVRIQRLSPAGRRSGQPIRVSLASDLTKNISNFSSKLSYDPISKNYLVLFLRYGSGGISVVDEGLYGAVYQSNLLLSQGPLLLSPLERNGSSILGPTVTDLKFHAPTGKFLAAGYTITREAGFSVQYFVTKINPSLQNPKLALMRLKNEVSSGAAPDVHLILLSNKTAIALFVEGTGLKKRKLNQLGTPIGPVSFFYSDTVRNIPVEFPISAVAENGNRSEISVVSVEDSVTMTGRIWLQTTTESGSLTDEAFSLQSGFDTFGKPAIVALPVQLPAGFLYAVIYKEGLQSFPPQVTDSSGLVLLRVNTTP